MGAQQSLNLHDRPLGILPQNLHRYAAGVVLGLLSMAALIFVVRRLAGALANPLEPAMLLAVAALVAAAAAAIRLSWIWPPPGNSLPRVDQAVMILTSLAVAGLGAGLCLPGTSVVGAFLLWTLLGAEESWAWGWRLRHGFEAPPSAGRQAVRTDSAHAGALRSHRGGITSRAAPTLGVEDAILPRGVTQQLTRSQASRRRRGAFGLAAD